MQRTPFRIRPRRRFLAYCSRSCTHPLSGSRRSPATGYSTGCAGPRAQDPIVLWSHALEALRRVCPELDPSISTELVAGAPLVDVVLVRLANDLAEQGDVALILDDFHRLSKGAARDSIAWLADHAPRTFRLVVSSRSEPALPLAALRAHGELLELRAAELGFTSEEADAFLNERLKLGLAHKDVEELVERTEGWPAGLYLAALSLQGAVDRRDMRILMVVTTSVVVSASSAVMIQRGRVLPRPTANPRAYECGACT